MGSIYELQSYKPLEAVCKIVGMCKGAVVSQKMYLQLIRCPCQIPRNL